jgi:hypothetical protein
VLGPATRFLSQISVNTSLTREQEHVPHGDIRVLRDNSQLRSVAFRKNTESISFPASAAMSFSSAFICIGG